MELDNEQLPEDVAAEAATDEATQEVATEGSQEPAPTWDQVRALLAEQAEQLRRQVQSQNDKLAARMERKLRGDPGQAALRVAREHGLQIPPDKEQQYLDGLKASGALAVEPDDESEPATPQSGNAITQEDVSAAGRTLALSLGLTGREPEVMALRGRTYDSPAEYFAAIQTASAAVQARIKGTQGAAGPRPAQGQSAAGQRRPVPPAMVPGGGSTTRVKDNPSWDDVADDEWHRTQNARR